MGIKNLTKFIKNNDLFKTCYITSNIETFAFTKIAIDTSLLIYKYKCKNASVNYNPDGWIWSFIFLIYQLRKNNIHPVFIFDGGFPPEKCETRENRIKSKETVLQKTRTLEESIQSYTSSKEQIPDLLQKEWTRIAKKKKLPSEDFDLNYIVEYVQQRQKYNISIVKQDYVKLKLAFKIMNCPFIQAPMEAEAFSAFFEKEGIVSAVFSTDTDLLAYGCKCMITDFSFNSNTLTFIDGHILLQNMELTNSEFLDFCILCGTDYNKNIPNIGPSKAYTYIKMYRSIENIPLEHSALETLNYQRVRHIYSTHGLQSESLNSFKHHFVWSATPFFDLLQSFLERININIDIDWIKTGFTPDNIHWM